MRASSLASDTHSDTAVPHTRTLFIVVLRQITMNATLTAHSAIIVVWQARQQVVALHELLRDALVIRSAASARMGY